MEGRPLTRSEEDHLVEKLNLCRDAVRAALIEAYARDGIAARGAVENLEVLVQDLLSWIEDQDEAERQL